MTTKQALMLWGEMCDHVRSETRLSAMLRILEAPGVPLYSLKSYHEERRQIGAFLRQMADAIEKPIDE